jgi:HIV-1 Vpr-binding protein
VESVCRLYEIGRTKRDDEDDDEEDGEDDDEEDGDEDDDDMVSVPGDNIFT